MTQPNSMEEIEEETATSVANIERYMDIINGDFTYDPVRLPIDQDPTQAIYDRKTLNTIWETTQHAQNPFTRPWFNVKNIIPWSDMREEMRYYINTHHEFSADSAEFDVIEDYAKILEAGQMKEYLNVLRDCVSESLSLQKHYWVQMWKKINLLRLYCQYHDENIETFRGLNGFRYLHKLFLQTHEILHSDATDDTQEEKEIKKATFDVCKELVKAVDLIGLRSSDILGEKSMGDSVFGGLLNILCDEYNNSENYPKIQSTVLRLFSQICDEKAVDAVHVLQIARRYLPGLGVPAAINTLSRFQAKDISREDLNYGIAILRRARMFSLNLNFDAAEYVEIRINVVILCIARVIEKRDKLGLTELPGLEKGLWVLNDILNEDAPLAATIQEFDILPPIFCVFKYVTDRRILIWTGWGVQNGQFLVRKDAAQLTAFTSELHDLHYL